MTHYSVAFYRPSEHTELPFDASWDHMSFSFTYGNDMDEGIANFNSMNDDAVIWSIDNLRQNEYISQNFLNLFDKHQQMSLSTESTK